MQKFETKRSDKKFFFEDDCFNSLIEDSHDVILLTDKGGLITFVSPNAKKILGYEGNELIHHRINDFIHQEDTFKAQNFKSNFFDIPRSVVNFKCRFKQKNGNFLLIESTSKNYLFDLNIKSIVHTLQDITNQQKNLDELNISQERFKIAQKIANFGTFEWDLKNNQINKDNSGFLYGFSSGEFNGSFESWLQIVHPNDRELVKNELTSSIQKKEDYMVEYKIIWPDKTIHYILTKAKIYFDQRGDVMKMIGINIDITDRKLIEKRKDDFITIASHELKTPVTILKGYFQILEKSLDSNSQALGFTNKIEEQINRLSDLITDLLNVSDIQSGKLELEKKKIRIDKLINGVVKDTQVLMKNHCLIVENKLTKEVVLDEYLIKIVLSNLILNAQKYSPKSESIIIRTKNNQKGFVVIEVQDKGIGIAKRDQDKIFQKFYQVNTKIRNSHSGFGMGLFICAEIIKKHGGEIKLESEKGKGSTFFISLPIRNKNNGKKSKI